jgi:hypothetical protein
MSAGLRILTTALIIVSAALIILTTALIIVSAGLIKSQKKF